MAFAPLASVTLGQDADRVFWLLGPEIVPSTGPWLGAFLYGDLQLTGSFTVSDVLQRYGGSPDIPLVGFLILGTPPPLTDQAALTAFGGAAVAAAGSFPLKTSGTPSYGFGAMVLWLPQLGSFTPEQTFGCLLPAVSNFANTYPYQLAPGFHRLFDAGGDGRLLRAEVDTGGVIVTLSQPTDPAGMILPLMITNGALPLAFTGGAFPGTAFAATTILLSLDSTEPPDPLGGCLSITGTTGDGLRNFELGFQHLLTSANTLVPAATRLFHPLLDRDEKLSGSAGASLVLSPLFPANPACNTLRLAAGASFISAYRTRLGAPLRLAPAGGLFQAATCPDASRIYLSPTGDFTLQRDDAPAASFELLGGLSGVEYLTGAAGDRLRFVSGQPAAFAYATVLDDQGHPHATFAPSPAGDRPCVTSWARFLPAAAQSYICESDDGPFYRAAGADARVLDFLPLGLFSLPSGAPTAPFPLLPYAAADVVTDAPGDDLTADFETTALAPARLAALIAGQPAITPVIPPGGRTWAVTPQGYVAGFVNGELRTLTLGRIDGTPDSAAELTFGSPDAALPPALCQAFLANRQFIVATVRPDAYTASIDLGGWKFDVSLPTRGSIAPGAYQAVLLVKSVAGTLKQFAGEPAAWTAYKTFNDAKVDTTGALVANWLTTYLAQAEALYDGGNGVAGLQTFVELINDPEWNGFIFLNVPLLGGKDLDPALQFLTAGLDPNALQAHHVGCAVNHSLVTANGDGCAPASSYFGLLHYLRDGAAVTLGTASPPFVPVSDPCDFQLLSLEAEFANSTLSRFRSAAQLVMNVLFGDPIQPISPDPAVPATNALLILGSMQTNAGVPHYVFASAPGSSSTFFPQSAAFARIEIDRAVVQLGSEAASAADTTSMTAVFQLSGWFGLSPLAAFDLLSYAAIKFEGLALTMTYGAGSPTFDAPDASGLVLPALPDRPLGDTETPNASGAGANRIYRPGSLASQFPLSVTRFVTGDGTRSPVDSGYRTLETSSPTGTLAKNTPWFALELDLPLGSGGALASGTLLAAKVLLAWNGGAGGGDAPIFQSFFLLQGPGGANLTLSIEGVLKLGAERIALVRTDAGAFVLQLASVGVSLLGKSFPPAGTTNLLLGGIPGSPTRALGWFGAYRSA